MKLRATNLPPILVPPNEHTGDASLAELYAAFFDAYSDQVSCGASCGQSSPDPEWIRIHGNLLLDGSTRIVGLDALMLIEDLLAGRTPGGIAWRPIPEAMAHFTPLVAPMALRFADVARRIEMAMDGVRADRRGFLRDHLLVQARTMAGLSAWTAAILDAAEAALRQDPESIAPALQRAADSLEPVLEQRAAAAAGPWTNWYRGDKKMNLPELLDRTRSLLTKLRPARS